MAAKPVGTSSLAVELSKLLSLPSNIISLDLHMAVDEIPVVTCTFYPELRADAQTTKTFEINEKEFP